ncbi:MAG: tRNA (guanosine(37)-N1)-methyltransferase TrmD [Candidatus Magasanikbacteria bacterium CG10_big_fil_rev_8_21_14_0_10_47_10]|uniref:tRNA (guanine-N(1)-)-methyltransferase n=1 Tax=Candidatus Magasanikbacteria bacterium CG10_big_fil_rev_8_21_14_0_10_47_10 TaxID=1974652 RepID=A0A2H0TQ14_9BACT|nr:MAG: tRNA (guanosine(37)-N1)-methyltransferase TrmD [Candidatus Magasanikbacteria bacterium CG10_big_fil_rev_8_21_14_0_10_47_10]
MKFNVITIFPDIITHYTGETILGRAQKEGHITVAAIDLRKYSEDKHHNVDDTPYGGGAGMVMKPEPLYKALKHLDAIPFRKADGLTRVKKVFNGSLKKKKRTIVLSPRGRQFDQRVAEQLSTLDEITFVCGRYEGIDQRVVDYMVDEEISIGPYVLAGGELGSLVIIEAVSRLLPGVLGNPESLSEETFNSSLRGAKGDAAVSSKNMEYPQYTKPSDFKGWKVPDVLLSGNHKKIKKWRETRRD